MNIHKILTDIEKSDSEVYERLDSRRGAMKSFASLGSKIALAAVPLALGSMFKKAYGQSNTDVVAVLNFALTLEYLEAGFYDQALLAGVSLIPGGASTSAITTIRNHERAHVSLLKSTITSLNGVPDAEPIFDFTAGGAFADVFVNYQTFLAVAQTFEDTGVRAYKGQAGALINSNDVLTAALQIHSVEARHASHIRQMRKALNTSQVIKPWITLDQNRGIGPAVQASYNGESLTKQLTIETVGINGNLQITSTQASESFDEPLTKAQVLAIIDPFII